MATPRENLLSDEHFTGMEQNTSTKQRSRFIEKSVFCSRGMQLQQHLEELKERERKAHQHNRQLLLQFERAQGKLREMQARNAAMKIIRMEYERYLDENLHRWQQQLLEKTQASQRKRMEDCRNLQQNKDQVSTATVDELLISKDLYMRSKQSDAPQTYMEERSAYGENNSSDYPHPGSSWLTQAGMVPGFLRAPFQPQTSSLFPPPNFPYSHLHLLPNLPSSPAHHQPCSRAEAAGWDPPCYNEGFSRGSAGQLHSEEPSALRVSQIVEEKNETNLGISKRARGGEVRRRLRFSPELDIKPVRLSSGHAESSESDRDSSLTSREKKTEKKGRTKPSSSESERCGSQKSSRTTLSPVAMHSETNSSSEEGGTLGGRSRKRGKGLCSGSVTPEKEAEELNRSKEDKMTDSCRGEDESDSEVIKSEEVDDEEGNSSEQSNTEERDEEEEKENSGSEDGRKENKVTSEEGSNVEEDEEEENNDGEEVEDGMEDEEDEEQLENRKQDSTSLQEEEEEENGGSEKEEEEQEGQLRSDEAGDSEDSIITPHNRSKQLRNIPKEAAEDEEEESKSDSLNNSKESSDEDIENLLAPQEPTNKTANTVKSEGNPKAKCLNLDIFQVTEASMKTDHKSDSDEFDHFYD